MASSKNVTDPEGPPPGETNNPDGVPKGTTQEKRPCPWCGGEYGSVPDHMRACEEGPDGD